MKNNTSGSVKSTVSQEACKTCGEPYAEPYVGMPIYLDDSFFDFINKDIGINCPMEDDMDDIMDDMDELMPENGMMPRNGDNKPENGNRESKPSMDTGNPIDYCKVCSLAMAYVPWQAWEEPYDMEAGFEVGTIFPSLDFPFLGGAGK